MTSSEAKWSERVRAWRESGESAQAFSADKGYAAASLKWWSSRLRRSKRALPSTRSLALRSAPERIAMARVIRRAEPRALSSAVVAPLVVEISGVRVVVGAGFDAALLREVVTALRGLGAGR